MGLGDRVDKTVRGWGSQFEVDVSWKIKEQLVYVGLAQYLDFVNQS